MHSVMPTECPLYARHYSRGQRQNDDQVKQGHCPLSAYILGGADTLSIRSVLDLTSAAGSGGCPLEHRLLGLQSDAVPLGGSCASEGCWLFESGRLCGVTVAGGFWLMSAAGRLWLLLGAGVVRVALSEDRFWLPSAAGLWASVVGGLGWLCWTSRFWDRCSPLAVSRAAFSFK